MKSFFPVLAFQKVGNPPTNSHLKNQWTSSKSLENWIRFLTKKRYHFVTPANFGKPLPSKPIMLTFIGGFQSFYTEVFPPTPKIQNSSHLRCGCGYVGHLQLVAGPLCGTVAKYLNKQTVK